MSLTSVLVFAVILSLAMSFATCGYIAREALRRRRDAVAVREAESRRLALLAASLDCVIGVDAAGTVIEFNDVAERTFGWSRQQILGRPLVDVIIPERLRASHLAGFARQLAGGDSVILGKRVELPALRADGREFPVELAVARAEWEGRPIFTAHLRDLSEQRAAERALRRSEASLQAFFHAANVYLCVIELGDDDFSFVTLNPAFASIFASTPELVAHKTGRAIGMTDEQVRFWMPHLRACAAEGTHRVAEYQFEFAGVTRWFDVSLARVSSLGEEPLQLGVAVSELTDRKQAELRILDLNRELESRVVERTAEFELACKELEAFAYSVSHDVRTPLRSIEGFAHLLASEHAVELSAAAREHLSRIAAATKRMAQLIDDLLSLSRVVRGGLSCERVDLSQLAGALVVDLEIRNRDRHVDVSIADDMIASGDPRLLRVALENLLGNAWKYTRGRAHARVEVGTFEHEGQQVYYVRDDGCGFDMGHAGKLFHAFQRLHDEPEFEGTGIGLATVARIVRRHGGDIWAEAAVNEGAAFYFTLARPRAPVRLAANG